MTVDIVDIVKVVRGIVRKEGRATEMAMKVVARIGDIEFRYVRLENGEPHEESKKRYGVQILDEETLRIPDRDYQALRRKVGKIFSEERPVRPRPRKKRPREGIQGELF